MNIGFIYVALIVLGCILAIALIWLIVEVIFSLRMTRGKVARLISRYARALEKGNVDLTYVKGDMMIEEKERR